MEYDWDVGWDSIPQILLRVGRSSVAGSVMAMISYFRVFGVKRFETNMTATCFLISFPLLGS